MICPNCQSENAEGAKFCNHCGAALFERPDRLIASSRREIQDLKDVPSPSISDPDFIHGLAPEPKAEEPTAPQRPAPYSTADLKTNPNLGASAPIPFKGESLAPVVEAMFTRKSSDPSVPATPTWDTSPLDFTGFEQLVDSSYVPPTPNVQTGDTLQMPAVETPQWRQGKDFRAPASSREEKQRRREEKHQERAQRKAERREARGAAHAQKKMASAQPASADEVPTPTAAATATATNAPADTATKIPTATPSDESSGPVAPTPPVRPRRSRTWIPIVIGILVVAAAIVGLTYYFELWGGKVVPDVVGLSETAGRGQLEGAGFSVRVVSVKSDEAPGTVLLTDPTGGARAPEGSEVIMHVSIARTVPDVVGKSRDEAEQILTEDGFTRVEYISQRSDENENLVLSIDPAPDTEAKASTPIKVTYAEPYIVPDVIGKTTDEAEAAITDAGLTVKTIYSFTEEIPEGTAVSTDPAAGTKVKGGSVVTLGVAKSRKSQLIEATTNFLAVGSSVRISGDGYPEGTYIINSVDSVTYTGGDQTTFTFTATPYGVTNFWFLLSPEVSYGEPVQISGTATWGNDGSLLTVYPNIAHI